MMHPCPVCQTPTSDKKINCSQKCARTANIAHLTEIALNRPNRYTEADDEVVRSLWGKKSTTVVAKRLGRTKSSLLQRATALGLRSQINRRKWTPEEDAQLLRFLEEGTGLKAMALVVKRSTNAVSCRLSTLKIRKEDYREWLSMDQVCALIGRSARSVDRYIQTRRLRGELLTSVRGGHNGTAWRFRPSWLREAIVRDPLLVRYPSLPSDMWESLVKLLADQWGD